jgi:hypothetical protein
MRGLNVYLILRKFICNFAKELYQLDLLHPTLWFMENWIERRTEHLRKRLEMSIFMTICEKSAL